MKNMLSTIIQQVMNGSMQNNPMMNIFNEMMSGKDKRQQIQTLLNSAYSKGIDVNEKRFSEQDLKMLGLK